MKKTQDVSDRAYAQVKWGKPDFHYSYTEPKTFTLGSFIKWFRAAERYYRVALQYEAQQQNKQCVDRKVHHIALKKYMHPRCAELLRYLKTVPVDRIM